jgi:CPA2 family monovalent cation:H+ antiporter-2
MTVAIIMLGKSVAAAVLVMMLRYPIKTALTVSASLAQIGEFSFILAGLGVATGLLSKEGQSLILAGALISIALNPFLFSGVGLIQRWFVRNPRIAMRLEPPQNPLREFPMSTDAKYLSNQVVLVGWGRVGKLIANSLSAQGIPFVVAEENRAFVEKLRQIGIPAVWGDATEPEVLVQAHIREAKALVIATPETVMVSKMTEVAQALNPHIQIVVRSHNVEEAELIQQESGATVFVGERELANSMLGHIEKLVKAA